MSGSFVYPTVDSVIAIHAEVLAAHGGSKGVREMALLESAVAAPRATMMGQPLLNDGVEIAAAYLFHICQNHPFVDGNKRTALATCLVFLAENNQLKNETLDVDGWEKLVLSAASGALNRGAVSAEVRPLLEKS